jgi:hypothetical protein
VYDTDASDSRTHIRVSFDAEPPAIFCTRRVRSSVLSSASCFSRSFLFLCTAVRRQRSCAGDRIGVEHALGLKLVCLNLAGHFSEVREGWV